jgi:Type I phosphodiesterase / nucleotide pyrophosphatase
VLKDFVLALSLSNLWFFNVWRPFLISHPNSYPYYHWKANPAPILLAAVFDVLLLATLMWLAVTIARRSHRQAILKTARMSFLFIFFVIVLEILAVVLLSTSLTFIIKTLIKRPQLLVSSPSSVRLYLWLWLLGLVVFSALIAILIKRLLHRRQELIKLAVSVTLILSPFVLVTFSQAGSQWIKYRSGEKFRENTAGAFAQRAPSGRRILWVVFDEMDFRLSFVKRPPTLELPEFDRLRNESIFASSAYPPAGDTVLSLPALISGRLISWSHRTGPNELMLTFGDNNQKSAWSAQPNVFSQARARGYNTALAGWYHPYCRIIGTTLTKCAWETANILFLPEKKIASLISHPDATIGTSMLRLGESVLLPDSIRVFLFGDDGRSWRTDDLSSYLNIQRRAVAMATDPDLHLILVHYPIPHPPAIYDRSKHDFSLNSNSGYLDNLALADRALAELRHEMENAGLWESTSVLISSDHGLRARRVWRDHQVWDPSFTKEDPAVLNTLEDERVPFILKLAGERNGLNYEPPFNTVLSANMLLALLFGEISHKEDVVKWLDEHRSIAQSPYVEGEK